MRFGPAQPRVGDRRARQVRRLEACIICRRAAVPLRALHPDDTYLFPGHPQELRDTGSHPVRLHVVRIDRHLTIRRIGCRVRRGEGRVALEGDVVFRLDDLRCPGQRRGRALVRH